MPVWSVVCGQHVTVAGDLSSRKPSPELYSGSLWSSNSAEKQTDSTSARDHDTSRLLMIRDRDYEAT